VRAADGFYRPGANGKPAAPAVASHGQHPPRALEPIGRAILEALNRVGEVEGVLTVGQLADQAGLVDVAAVRVCLAGMEARGLVRKRSPGYVITAEGTGVLKI
jgi:ribosomal protein S19E (S16A)